VAVTFDKDISNNQQKLYLNGTLLKSINNTQPIGTNTIPLLIGSYNVGAGSGNFNGSLDDIRIYNRVLSADEIQALYSNSAGRYH